MADTLKQHSGMKQYAWTHTKRLNMYKSLAIKKNHEYNTWDSVSKSKWLTNAGQHVSCVMKPSKYGHALNMVRQAEACWTLQSGRAVSSRPPSPSYYYLNPTQFNLCIIQKLWVAAKFCFQARNRHNKIHMDHSKSSMWQKLWWTVLQLLLSLSI